MYHYQFGFRKGNLTEQTILIITYTPKRASDKKKMVTRGLFLRLFKGFHTVNHNILLSKLYPTNGVRGSTLLTEVKDYLHNRTQFVKIGNTKPS